MNLIILPAIVVLFTALITPAHAQSTIFKSITPDSLATEITSAIRQGDYTGAEQLFNNYDILGLDIPVPLKAKHAEVYRKLGKFGLASQELEQYLTVVGRDSWGYDNALTMYGDIKEVEENLLSAYGFADINAKNSQGETLLDQAIEAKDKPLIGILSDWEVINLNTLLYDALKEKAFDAAKLLIDVGADTKAKNKDGWTPWDIANQYELSTKFKDLLRTDTTSTTETSQPQE